MAIIRERKILIRHYRVMARFARLSTLGIFSVLLFFYVSPTFATPKVDFTKVTQCPRLLTRLNELQIQIKLSDRKVYIPEEFYESPDGPRTLRLIGLPKREGYIVYEADHEDRFISIHDWAGARSIPMGGAYLLAHLRGQYPDYVIRGLLIGTNAERIKRALTVNPDNPDFTDVPCVYAAPGRFFLEKPDFKFRSHELGGKNHPDGWEARPLYTLLPLESRPPIPEWVDKDKFLADPSVKTFLKESRK